MPAEVQSRDTICIKRPVLEPCRAIIKQITNHHFFSVRFDHYAFQALFTNTFPVLLSKPQCRASFCTLALLPSFGQAALLLKAASNGYRLNTHYTLSLSSLAVRFRPRSESLLISQIE